MQNGLHTGLHPVFSEGQGACGDHPSGGTAVDQGVGIGLFAFFSKLCQHLFVTGKLDILAQKDIPHPQQGVEPIHRKEQEPQGLPKVILPLQMGFFMGQNMFPVCALQTGGQIDPRPDQTQNKGGVNVVTYPDILRHIHTGPDPMTNPQDTDQGIQHHDPHPRQPDHGPDQVLHLNPIDAVSHCHLHRLWV